MNKVVLYHQDSCGMCRTVEMLLNKNAIEHESCKDIEYMKSIGITHTPTLEVDGNRIEGPAIIRWIKER